MESVSSAFGIQEENSNPFRIFARWTLENWRKCHQHFAQTEERFCVPLPNVGQLQFFFKKKCNTDSASYNNFQYYDLGVKIRRNYNIGSTFTVRIRATVSYLSETPQNEDSYSKRDFFFLKKKPLKTTETVATLSRLISGFLGYSGRKEMDQRIDPKVCNDPQLSDLLNSDTVFLHFLIIVEPDDIMVNDVEVEGLLAYQSYGDRALHRTSFSGFDDVCLMKNDGKKLFAHRGILTARGDRLGDLLTPDSLASESWVIETPGINLDIMRLILEYVYTGEIELLHLTSTSSTLSELIQAAHNHNMNELLDYVDCAVQDLCNTQNLLQVYGLCKKYSLEKGLKFVVEYVSRKSLKVLCTWAMKEEDSAYHAPSSSDGSLKSPERFEKVTKISTISIKGKHSWTLDECEINRRSAYLTLSQVFDLMHLLVNFAAELEIVYNENVKRYLQCSSKTRFPKNENLPTKGPRSIKLDEDFFTGLSLHKAEKVIFHMDVEVIVDKEATGWITEVKNDIVVLNLKDGHCLPVEKSKQASNPVFRAMFFGNMKESKETSVSIPDVSLTTMPFLVEFIYKEKVDGLWKANVEEVLEAATKYLVSGLVSHVGDNLVQLCNPENALELYKLARIYDLEKAQDDIAAFVSKNAAEVLDKLLVNE